MRSLVAALCRGAGAALLRLAAAADGPKPEEDAELPMGHPAVVLSDRARSMRAPPPPPPPEEEPELPLAGSAAERLYRARGG